MKRYISIFLSIIVCFLMQTTIFKHLKIAGVVPNFLIVITAISGFMHGRKVGMFAGVICGIFMDFIYADIMGINILIYTVIGYLNGMQSKVYFKKDMLMPLLSITVSDLLYGMIYYVFRFLLRGRLALPVYFKEIIVPEAVYTLIVGIVVYKIAHWLDKKLYPPVEVGLRSEKSYD